MTAHCSHPSLHWNSGGYYIACQVCAAVWVACDQSNDTARQGPPAISGVHGPITCERDQRIAELEASARVQQRYDLSLSDAVARIQLLEAERDAWREATGVGDKTPDEAEALIDATAIERDILRVEQAKLVRALRECIGLIEGWQNGILASVGVTWEADPPALVFARRVVAYHLAPKEDADE